MVHFALPSVSSLLCFLRMHASNECPKITMQQNTMVIADSSAGYTIRISSSKFANYDSMFKPEIICDKQGNILELKFPQKIKEISTTTKEVRLTNQITTDRESDWSSEIITTVPVTTETGSRDIMTTEPATTETGSSKIMTTELVTTETGSWDIMTTEPATTETGSSKIMTTELVTTETGSSKIMTTEPTTTETMDNCEIPYIERVFSFIDSEGNLKLTGDILNGSESVTFACDQVDRRLSFTINCSTIAIPNIPNCKDPIYIVGGISYGDRISGTSMSVFYPDNPYGSYITDIELPANLNQHISFRKLDNHLFMFYGAGSNFDIEHFMLDTKTWSSQMTHTNAIEGPVINKINDNLYVCGGGQYNGHDFVGSTSCMKYNLTDDSWKKSFPMNQPSMLACSFVLDEKIYVVGGCSYGINQTVQVFDPAHAVWGYSVEYEYGVYGCGATSFNSLGYVCGGYSTRSAAYTNECFVFDAKRSIWIPIAPMNEKRAKFHLVEYYGKIYAILGGVNDFTSASNTIEWNDPAGEKKWTLIGGMGDLLMKRSFFSVA